MAKKKIRVECEGAALVPLSSLVGFQGDFKTLSKKEFEKLRTTIETDGFSFPVFAWKSGGKNHIIDGHQRVQTVRAMLGDGFELPGGKLPVAWIEAKSEREAKRKLLLASAQYGRYDEDSAYQFIKQAGLDFADLKGVLDLPQLNMDQLEAGWFEDDLPEGADDVPPLPKKATSKRGQTWTLGEHRLVCGDCRDAEDVAKVLGKARAVLMNTDPPYGSDYAGLKDGIPRSGFKDIKARGGAIENDDLTSGPELQQFLEEAIRAALPVLTSNPAFYLWHPMLTQGTFFAAAADILIHRQIIWVKPHMVLTRSGQYHWKHELCFYGWIRRKPCPWYGDKSQVSVWPVGEKQQDRQHPTQKPVALFIPPLTNHTKPGEWCYEPFAGSGSQVIAAEMLERRCAAIEIDPRYCDVTIERWQTLSGGKAKLTRL